LCLIASLFISYEVIYVLLLMLDGFSAVDIGSATVKLFEEAIGLSNTIIWNGPMGIFEIDRL